MHQHRLSKVAQKKNSSIETTTQNKSLVWTGLDRSDVYSDLDQLTMSTVGWMSVLFGTLLLVGEYLCVEVAWLCLEYDDFRVAFAVSMIVAGVISITIGAKND